jgi:Fic family protein
LKPGVNHKNLDEKQEEILKYKTALDYLNQEWLVNPKNVTLRDLLSLYDIFGKGSLNGPSSNLQDLLDYIQAHRENPIIQSGVAFLGIERTTPFTTGNSRFARLLAYLFLYKDGYDVKGLIQFDKKWAEDLSLLNDALRVGLSAASITIWLEFYAQSIIENLRATLEEIGKTKDYNIGLDNSLWEINDRQKEILNLLEQPNTTITNRKVTKRFKISQITASRDLSKLATLGLLFPHGKGRSVYYTKV